jgi:hypothetical protein
MQPAMTAGSPERMGTGQGSAAELGVVVGILAVAFAIVRCSGNHFALI